ncbi:alanine racemase [Ferrimonas gelatinilytica]|uniref:Alanine racemase n=1 Tax=Ferrimonas gelatinilytica TaxID=1255257 RepID=A0ABP9S7C1_9GAMM
MHYSPVAEIRRTALMHNITHLRSQIPETKLMAVIKADAYGHGLVQVARWLTGAVDGFAVARIEEAVTLRESGVEARILILAGVFNQEGLEQATQYDLDLVIHDAYQVGLLEQANLPHGLKIWLKHDSGMHRLGVRCEEFQSLYRRLSHCACVRLPLNTMTHFATADEADGSETERQIARFEAQVQDLPGERALCNSAGVLRWPSAHGDWVRVGLAIYGANPMVGGRAQQIGLQPVMTLKTRVLAVRPQRQGEAAGYGQIWRAERDTRIAVVAVGYGDGYPRHAASGTPVLINGQRFPLVGRVSMDTLMVEIGDAPVAVGDEVILWGQGLPVEEIAEHAETIPYELLSQVTGRVRFHYLEE